MNAKPLQLALWCLPAALLMVIAGFEKDIRFCKQGASVAAFKVILKTQLGDEVSKLAMVK